uniref:DUF4105 domain-containing protein n=1 Tax=Roseihalotalea indica TaxID=2867963 RepID=A0AA49GU56_9BACT|nr:DUF4105 domain-containing protein [Tunicatimonas sp. TK19036]
MHRIRISLTFSFLVCLLPLAAQSLSPQASISLLTYSPGDQLYTTFGHSALRVKDPAQSLDIVFNYGTFDFDEAGFYLKFMRGKLNYKLSAYDYRYVELEQDRRQMDVREQVFNLNPTQTQALFDFLNINLLPENRFYLYDFFFDNCATRIPDALEDVLGHAFQLDTTFIPDNERMTFRELISVYLAPQPWGDFGIDLALGAPIDIKATPRQYMFLPDYLAEGLAGSKIIQQGQAEPFVRSDEIILSGTKEVVPPPEYTQPRWIFTVLFGAFLLWAILTRRLKPSYWPDMSLLTLYSLLGILLLLLWFATDHQATHDNWNLLWAHPLHLITVVLLARKEKGAGTKLYFLINGFLYLGVVAFWDMVPQEYHPAAIPLVLLLAFRYFYQYHQINLRQQVPRVSARATS